MRLNLFAVTDVKANPSRPPYDHTTDLLYEHFHMHIYTITGIRAFGVLFFNFFYKSILTCITLLIELFPHSFIKTAVRSTLFIYLLPSY